MMEYDEPEEVIAADNKAFQHFMLTADRGTAALVAAMLTRSYKGGRSRGRSDGFSNGFACGVPLP